MTADRRANGALAGFFFIAAATLLASAEGLAAGGTSLLALAYLLRSLR